MQNLQCDWLLSVHYNTTMHGVSFRFASCCLGDPCDQIQCSFYAQLIIKSRRKQREKEGEKAD